MFSSRAIKYLEIDDQLQKPDQKLNNPKDKRANFIMPDAWISCAEMEPRAVRIGSISPFR
jgi:hypothetical protein